MESCPHCSAPVSISDIRGGRCPTCDMALSVDTGLEEHEEATAQPSLVGTGEVVSSTLRPAEPPPNEQATLPQEGDPFSEGEEDEGPTGDELIKPRELSPEYARRVTMAWKQTHSQYKNPKETIKAGAHDEPTGPPPGKGSDKGSTFDRGGSIADLNIGQRAIGQVTDDVGNKDYELTEEIGKGAMGVVWSARQTSLDREVAIKMPKGSAARSSSGRRQFMSEVVVTGQLDHPNIVPIYDLAKSDTGELFYSMKRVEGRPWNELLEGKELSQQENLEILMKVCDAVRFAHDRGVLHRDIKPHNVMVGQYGEVSVMDWGIALRLDIGPGGTMAPTTKISPAGTPAYMAPEMATGAAASLGPATDVYLLGAVLYEILEGEPPHPPPSESSSHIEVLNEALLIAARNVVTPIEPRGELADVAYRALATDNENRYQTVGEFQDAIRDYLAHAESIKLTRRGESLLNKAKANGYDKKKGTGSRFDDYDRARFAFEEAISIWPENRTARKLLGETLIAYAGYAHDQGAFARGIALLSDDNPEHKSLLRKLRAAQNRTNRLSALLKAAVALIIIGGAVFTFFLNRERNRAVVAKNEAVEAQQEERLAKEAAIEAQMAETKAKNDALAAQEKERLAKEAAILAQNAETEAKNKALKAQEAERIAKQDALDSADREKKAKDTAVAAQRESQRSAYNFEIGLAAEEVQRNAFGRVEEILTTQSDNPVTRELLNWEWSHLNAMVQQGAQTFSDRGGKLLQSRVEATAISANGEWLAAGGGGGDVYVWRAGGGEAPRRLPLGEATYALAITPDGATLVAAGRETNNAGVIKIWTLPAPEGAEADRQIATHSASILSLDLRSQPGAPTTVLFSAANGEVGLVPIDGSAPVRPAKATSLESSIYSAKFSPDGKWIVTAGEDGAVRVWDSRLQPGADGAVDPAWEITDHVGPVYTALFSPNGDYLVSAGRDRRIMATAFDSQRVSSGGDSRAETIEERLRSSSETIVSKSQGVAIGEHDAAVRSLAFSTDGNVLFSGGHDHTVRVWEVSEGWQAARPLKTLRGHGGWVRSCVAAPDNPQEVISGGYDRRVRRWNWNKYEIPLVLKNVSDRVSREQRLTASAASPDGRWVATGSKSGVVTIWDTRDYEKPQELAQGHDWQATTGLYLAGGRRLLTAGGDNTALVWDEAKGSELVRLGGWNKSVGAGWRGVATATEDGRLIATGADGQVLARVWDAQTGRLLASVDTPVQFRRTEEERPEATSMAFSPDGSRLVLGDQWGQVYLASSANNWRPSGFAAHSSKVSGIEFTPDGDAFLTAGYDGAVQKWDFTASGAVLEGTFRHRDRVVAMDLSPDGQTMVTATGADDPRATLRVWRLDQPEEPTHTLPPTALGGANLARRDGDLIVRSVSIHPREPQALVTFYDPDESGAPYRIGRWAWTNGADEYRLVPTGPLRDVSTAVFTPHREDTILTVGGRGARRRRLDFASTEVVMNYRPQTEITSLSFSPGSNELVSASRDGSLVVWRYNPEAQQWSNGDKIVGQHRGAITSVTFHPTRDGVMLTAGEDGDAKLWSLRDGAWDVDRTMRVGQPGDDQPMLDAQFVPTGDDSLVIVTGGGHGAHLWKGIGGPERITGDAPACCVAPSPDGRQVVVSVGPKATLYDLDADAAPVAEFSGHAEEITSLAFVPDGSRLFTTSRDLTIKLWEPNTEAAAEDGETEQRTHELLTLEGHADEVTSLSVAVADGRAIVISTGLDGQAILWPSQAPAP